MRIAWQSAAVMSSCKVCALVCALVCAHQRLLPATPSPSAAGEQIKDGHRRGLPPPNGVLRGGGLGAVGLFWPPSPTLHTTAWRTPTLRGTEPWQGRGAAALLGATLEHPALPIRSKNTRFYKWHSCVHGLGGYFYSFCELLSLLRESVLTSTNRSASGPSLSAKTLKHRGNKEFHF